MAKGVRSIDVLHKSGKVRSIICPMLRNEYLIQAERECVITQGVTPEFKAWVARLQAKAGVKVTEIG